MANFYLEKLALLVDSFPLLAQFFNLLMPAFFNLFARALNLLLPPFQLFSPTLGKLGCLNFPVANQLLILGKFAEPLINNGCLFLSFFGGGGLFLTHGC